MLAMAALLPVPLTAQMITGTVRGANGVGVPGVNIDCFDPSGNELDLLNDGTDANGNFTTTVVDGPGVYDFIFYPPAPPVTTHLVGERNGVVVATTTNLGTVTLGAGVLLSGRTVRNGTIPVANVTLTVIDKLTDLTVTQVQTKTNAFGQFNLAVPPHAIELQLDANTSAFLLGSRSKELAPSADRALGDIQLPPGALVTAHVQRANGVALNGADFDFVNLATGRTAFVPNDNTNTLGNLSCVVPVGTWEIEICPRAVDALPAKALHGVVIAGTTNLGTLVVPNGVRLFGTVLTAHGNLASGVDVDVFDAVTGVEVPLCGDDTNASGAYSVYVPVGTYDVLFLRNGAGAAIGGDLHTNVVVNALTQLNGQLPLRGNGNSFGGTPRDGGLSTP